MTLLTVSSARYLLQWRMRLSAVWLRTEDMPVAEVAAGSGTHRMPRSAARSNVSLARHRRACGANRDVLRCAAKPTRHEILATLQAIRAIESPADFCLPCDLKVEGQAEWPRAARSSAPTNASITRTGFSSETYSSIVAGSKALCSRLKYASRTSFCSSSRRAAERVLAAKKPCAFSGANRSESEGMRGISAQREVEDIDSRWPALADRGAMQATFATEPSLEILRRLFLFHSAGNPQTNFQSGRAAPP